MSWFDLMKPMAVPEPKTFHSIEEMERLERYERKRQWSDDNLQGQKDCKAGILRKDRSEAYARGWKTEYLNQEIKRDEQRRRNIKRQ